jgi:hypothetical protein
MRAVYEEHEKPEPNSFGNVSLLGHTVFLRRIENGLPIVKSWTLMGNFRLSNLIRSTFEMVSKATPNGQLHNQMPTTFGQRLLFVAALNENGGRAGDLHGALSIIPPKESPVARLLLRLDSFCNALLEGKFGPSNSLLKNSADRMGAAKTRMEFFNRLLKILIGSSSHNDFFS